MTVGNDNIIQYIYTSHATQDFSDDELSDLLRHSNANNALKDITGMLVYENRIFIQLLEGPEQQIRRLVDTISRDPRHDQFTELAEMEISRRSFPDWSMGFRRINPQQDNPTEIKGFSNILHTIWKSPSLVAEPTPLVEAFKALVRANL
jgi:hypothetical protein